MVAEQYLGVPVKCGRCGRSFTTRVDVSTQRVRLDIAAGSAGRFLAQHVVYWNLDQRHELAVLVIAGDPGLDAVATALAPLLAHFLNGARPDAAGAAESIAAASENPSAALVVIWDGQVSIGGSGEHPIYHHSGGRLTRLRREPVKLAAGDWLVLTGDDSHPPLDEAAWQRQIAASSSAVTLMEHPLPGASSSTILTVRCY